MIGHNQRVICTAVSTFQMACLLLLNGCISPQGNSPSGILEHRIRETNDAFVSAVAPLFDPQGGSLSPQGRAIEESLMQR